MIQFKSKKIRELVGLRAEELEPQSFDPFQISKVLGIEDILRLLTNSKLGRDDTDPMIYPESWTSAMRKGLTVLGDTVIYRDALFIHCVDTDGIFSDFVRSAQMGQSDGGPRLGESFAIYALSFSPGSLAWACLVRTLLDLATQESFPGGKTRPASSFSETGISMHCSMLVIDDTFFCDCRL